MVAAFAIERQWFGVYFAGERWDCCGGEGGMKNRNHRVTDCGERFFLGDVTESREAYPF